MRSAEVAEIWRTLEGFKRAPHIRTFEYGGLAGLADGALEFTSPVTAICGLSGSGKSALLRALLAALQPEMIADNPQVLMRLNGLVASVTLDRDGEAIKRDIDLRRLAQPPHEDKLEVEYLDLSTSGRQLQDKLCGMEVEVLLDAYSPITLKPTDVSLLRFICKKDYTSVKIYEIDEFGEVLPFIVVEDANGTYDCRTMGLGEISVFLCYWALKRAKAGAIVLFEEPETYIPPVSQTALVDFLASVSVRQRVSMIFTTHSPQIVSRLKPHQIKFLYRGTRVARFATEDQQTRMGQVVGLTQPIDSIILVEDRAAREFTRLLLSKLDVSLLLRSEILDVGGHANITGCRRSFPRRAKSVVVLGVYDGDMRGVVEENGDEWPFVFLPGESSVEALFRKLGNEGFEDLATKLGMEPHALDVVLAALQGLNDHDWFEELAKAVGKSYEQAMFACFEAWIAIKANAESAAAFGKELSNKLGGDD